MQVTQLHLCRWLLRVSWICTHARSPSEQLNVSYVIISYSNISRPFATQFESAAIKDIFHHTNLNDHIK